MPAVFLLSPQKRHKKNNTDCLTQLIEHRFET